MGTNAWPVVPVLMEALEDDPLTVRHAAWALAGMQASAHPDWERLSRRLDGNSHVACAFACILNSVDESGNTYGPTSCPFALAGLAATGRVAAPPTEDRPPPVRELHVCICHIHLTPYEDHQGHIHLVRECLKHDYLSQYWHLAVAALDRMGAGQDSYVPRLLEVLKESWHELSAREAAVEALAWARTEPPGVRELFRQMLDDPSPQVRLASARALWKWKAPAEELLPTLKGLLGHKLVSIRKGALALLAEMGVAALPVRPEIERLAQADADETVRAAANAALKVPGLGIPRLGNGR